MNPWLGIGVMSGTSLDGVDIAACSFAEEGDHWQGEILTAETVELPAKWKRQLRDLPQGSAVQYAALHTDLGHFLGREIAGFIRRHGLNAHYVASHGQTIFHQPAAGFTAQIGDGETLAAHLDIPLVTNFRSKDVAMEGEGAPLVPFGEAQLFNGYEYYLNLGGFANISHGGIAYDLCPCNLPMNLLAASAKLPESIDRDGEVARNGKTDPVLLAWLNSIPWYQQAGPKSLGIEWLEEQFIPLLNQNNSPAADQLNTLCEHIASQVSAAVRKFGAQGSMLVTGGGARNLYLMETLRKHLKPEGVDVPQAADLLIDFKEAYIFAFLGLMTLLGRSNTLKSVTGASRDVCGGSIHLPPGGGYRLF